ncbi:hypothetical protein U729_3074 (plasmid) [Clostridium baratii str. Sullivan]|uniref:Uncharacterized protein n=1 Tax=Clostridium baratii str. Sullivan TaxID=1415775 RepID=A0A0A7G0A8_9CLOT|nr:hypothetical protein [Clostridium baratii]AIY85272.1 hypothetical protein U729_3074 [Clostridium baratii str. Sullivan]
MIYRDLIDLEEQFNYLLNKFGSNIIYVRHSEIMKCDCYNELFKKGDPNCNNCLGSGKALGLRMSKIIIKNSLGDYKEMTSGFEISKSTTLYMPNTYKPKAGDYILFAEYDKNGYVDNVTDVYEVSCPNETRGDNGKIEFFSLKGILRKDKTISFNKLIKNMNSFKKKLLKDGRCIDARRI